MTSDSGRTIEFWFDFASSYSYIAAMRIEDEATRRGLTITWRPFLLGPIFEEQLGLRDSPFNVHPFRGRYMWRDLERLCAKYGLPWQRPTVFPRNSVLAARIACFGSAEAWCPDFVRGVFAANFGTDEDIAAESLLSRLLLEAGAKASALAEASAPAHKGLLRQSTEQASQRGFFGAPNFVVAGEHFFGQDRLDDALDWATRA